VQTSLSYRHPFEGPLWRRVMLLGVRHFPRPVQVATMPFWAALFFGPLPRVWQVCGRNLDRLDAPLPPGAREVRTFRLMVNYAQAITDAYRCHVGGPVPVTAVFHGRERLAAARAAGTGVVVVTGHLGAWQIGPYLLAREGLAPLTVAMAAEPNPALQKFMESFPRPFDIVYTNGSAFGSLGLRTTLTAGGLVCMQLDRPLGEAHVTLPFCGGRARFATGPAALARTTGAPLLPSFLVMGPGPEVHVHVEAPIVVARTRDRAADLAAATAAAVARYERHARAVPRQWFNFYDFWEAA
jgi:Kdo2-lipid IVA lauroyltransferase/acyltransferase